MKYRVLLHKSEEGYTAYCPGLGDSKALGSSPEEALENIRYEISGSITEREGAFWEDVVGDEELHEVDVNVAWQLDTGRGGSAKRYEIEMLKSSEGYTVSCPTLPGCISEGETFEEALENIQIAIREWLIMLQELLLLGTPLIKVVEIDDEDQLDG